MSWSSLATSASNGRLSDLLSSATDMATSPARIIGSEIGERAADSRRLRPLRRACPTLHRHADDSAKPAERAVAERDVAAVRARNVARDGKAQARAALVLVARIVEAKERLEHIVAHVDRNAGPVIVHRHRKPAMVAMAGDRHGRSEARGVGDEVGETALERRRPHCDL